MQPVKAVEAAANGNAACCKDDFTRHLSQGHVKRRDFLESGRFWARRYALRRVQIAVHLTGKRPRPQTQYWREMRLRWHRSTTSLSLAWEQTCSPFV